MRQYFSSIIAKVFGYNIRDVRASIVVEIEQHWGQFSCIFLRRLLLPWFQKFLHVLHDAVQEHLSQFSLFFLVLGWLSMLTQPPRKRLAQREPVLRPIVNSPQTSVKVLWIYAGFLPRKDSILIYDLWSEIVIVLDTPAGFIFSSC